MKKFLKRFIFNLLLLVLLLIGLKKCTEIANAKNTTSKIAVAETAVIEIKSKNMAKKSCNDIVSIKKADFDVVTSEVEELDNTENEYIQEMFQAHKERWQPVFVDFANMKDVYNEFTYPLAKIIYAEGGNQNDQCQQYIGYVVINRIESKYYPNSLNSVFFSGGYAIESQEIFLAEQCSDRAIANAVIVVNNYLNCKMPVSPALVFQACFKQGVGSFKVDDQIFGYDKRILKNLEK